MIMTMEQLKRHEVLPKRPTVSEATWLRRKRTIANAQPGTETYIAAEIMLQDHQLRFSHTEIARAVKRARPDLNPTIENMRWYASSLRLLYGETLFPKGRPAR